MIIKILFVRTDATTNICDGGHNDKILDKQVRGGPCSAKEGHDE